jgi:hypothetical protein
MSKNIVSNVGGFIGKNKIALLYIGGAIAVVSIGLPLIKRVRKIFSTEVESAREFSYMEDIKVNQSNATITPSQAKVFSNQLVTAMSISSGTDESTIKSIFEKIKNKDDMSLLYKTFGVRKYSGANSGEASGFLWGIIENAWGYTDLDLAGWLKEELGVLDWRTKKIVNEKLNLIGLEL